MKTKLINKKGELEGEINLPNFFSFPIREDICQKYFHSLVYIQPHAPYKEAGKRHSASGIIRRARHKWKTSYGREMSRTPRKILWRRGSQFYWIGAEVANTRGGRRAHPTKIEHFLVKKKINKKEKEIALKSALAATASLEKIKERYEKLKDINLKINLPVVIKSDVLELKTKDFFKLLEKVFKELKDIAIQKKKIRAGKGKLRSRKYKKNSGVLLILGKNEKFKIKGIEVVKVNELNIKNLWPLGRLTIYTENSLKELKERFEKNDN
ncbi:MAG: 50S ribosomal protein L4 [Candidatus Pacearchaeota archaeon]